MTLWVHQRQNCSGSLAFLFFSFLFSPLSWQASWIAGGWGQENLHVWDERGMSEMANDSLLIKSAASERSDGSDVRQKEVCSYVWTSHTHREGTLDSAIRCYHGKHSRGPSVTVWVALKKNIEKKKNWTFFFFAACSFFFFFHNLRQGHREVSNIMVWFNQKVSVGEELRRLGLCSPGWEMKSNNKDGAFLNLFYHCIITCKNTDTFLM